jgi:hypothetical protein
VADEDIPNFDCFDTFIHFIMLPRLIKLQDRQQISSMVGSMQQAYGKCLSASIYLTGIVDLS